MGSWEYKGGSLTELWRNDPNWLMDSVEWPQEVEVYATEGSNVEREIAEEIFKAARNKDDKHQHQVLSKLNFIYLFTCQLEYLDSY